MFLRLPILATLVTLVAFVTMLYLGMWQLDRAQQKQQRLQQIQLKTQLAPMGIDELRLLDDMRDAPVAVVGRFLAQVFLLDNRVYQGKVGYQLVAVLQTDSGDLLVNLGWLKAPEFRQQVPEYEVPVGLVEVQGMVAVPQLNPMIRETAGANDGWPKVVQQLDIPKLEALRGNGDLLDWVLLLSPEADFGYVREWQPVVMPPQKHQAYAMQWFALAIAAIVVYAAVLRRRKSDRKVEV